MEVNADDLESRSSRTGILPAVMDGQCQLRPSRLWATRMRGCLVIFMTRMPVAVTLALNVEAKLTIPSSETSPIRSKLWSALKEYLEDLCRDSGVSRTGNYVHLTSHIHSAFAHSRAPQTRLPHFWAEAV